MTPAPDSDGCEIVHIVDSFATGGLERQVFNMLAHGDLDAYVICLSKAGHFGTELERLGTRVIYLTSETVLGRLSEINRLFTRHPAEIIHCHNQKAYFYGSILSRIHKGVHIILSLHGETFVDGKLSSFISSFFARTDWIIAVSDKIKEKAHRTFGGDKSRILIVANGTPFLPKKTREQPEGRPLCIGAVGRLEEVKNYPMLIQAFARLRKENDSLRLILVGDGSERSKLERLVEELGISSQVEFTGMQEDVGRFLDKIDVFAISSHTEGLPLALLEAASHCIPVVSTAVGAIPTILSDGESVLLSDPESEDGLVENLQRCIYDSELRASLARNAYDVLKQTYSIDASIRAHMDIYQRLKQS